MRELHPPSWERLGPESMLELPRYARPRRILLRHFIGGGLVLVIAGLFGATPGPAAFGWALLVHCLLAYYRTRRAARNWQMRVLSVDKTVQRGAKVGLKLAISNPGPFATGPILLRVPFPGGAFPDHYFFVASLSGGERRRVDLALPADRAVGQFVIGPIEVVVQDPLGLFSYGAEFPWTTEVEVVPRVAKLHRFPAVPRGTAVHSGPFDTRVGGDSVTFLGLREWRKGDGTRRIDWRRSVRFQQLLVKDFERLLGTDATILVDQGPFGHNEFGELSSIESMKEAALAVGEHLLSQQVRVQLITHRHAVPFGLGTRHADLLREALLTLRVEPDASLRQSISQAFPLIPPGSLVLLFLTTAGSTVEELLPGLLALEDRRVQPLIFAFDSTDFAARARAAARLPISRTAPPNNLAPLLARFPSRTYVMKPGDDIAARLEGRQ